MDVNAITNFRRASRRELGPTPNIESDADFKVTFNQDPIPNYRQQEDTLMSLDSFGNAGDNNVKDFMAKETIRVETKWCYLAFLEGPSIYYCLDKQKQKKGERRLEIVRALPFFKGVTRNTHMRIGKAIVPQWQELNQVLIRQGESNEDRKVFIIHKGEFLVTRKI